MDIITKLKNILINLYSNKAFKIFFAIIFVVFILKNYSSVPQHIEKIKDKEKVLSIRQIKEKMEVEAILKQKKQEQIAKNIATKNETKGTETKADSQKLSLNNVGISKDIAQDGDLVTIEMVLIDTSSNKIITKVDEMPVIINNDETNIFAKYLKGRKVGSSVAIPISEFADQPLPTNTMLYKLTIKSIKQITNKKPNTK